MHVPSLHGVGLPDRPGARVLGSCRDQQYHGNMTRFREHVWYHLRSLPLIGVARLQRAALRHRLRRLRLGRRAPTHACPSARRAHEPVLALPGHTLLTCQ